MALVETTLAEAGVHEELIYIERFVSPADADRGEVGDDELAGIVTIGTYYDVEQSPDCVD